MSEYQDEPDMLVSMLANSEKLLPKRKPDNFCVDAANTVAQLRASGCINPNILNRIFTDRIKLLEQENNKYLEELYESEKEKCGFLKVICMLENRLNKRN